MPLGVGDIPLTATPGVMQGMSEGNALNQQNIQNQIENIKRQYSPLTLQAEAMSKVAYANLLPYQIQAQVMSNPMLWMAMKDNPEGMRNMMNNLVNAVPKPGQQFNMPQLPNQSSSGGLLDMLINKLTGNDSSNAMQNTPSPSSSGNALTGAGQNQDAIMQTLPTSQGSPNPLPPSVLPGTSQNPYFEVKQAGATAEAQGKANADMWKTLHESTANAAVQAQDTLNDLDRFKESYTNLGKAEKGFGLGSLPAFTSEAQIADQAANSMRASLLRQLQQGHITNKDFDIGMGLKPSRALNPKAEKEISAFMQGTAQRAQERVAFNNTAYNMGMTTQQANLVWTKYIHEKPFFDAKKGQVIDENLNSWNDYLKPENVRQALNPQQNTSQQVSVSAFPQDNIVNTFDPTKMLDYKYRDKNEFLSALSSLNAKNRALVVAEMHRRGWH